jgi:hypothetical protein
MQKAALAPPFLFTVEAWENIDLLLELAYRPRDPTNQGWTSEPASALSRPSQIGLTKSNCDRW